MANTFKNDTYRSSKTLSYIAIALLGSLMICAVFFVLFSFGMLAYPSSSIDLGEGESLPVALSLIGILALLRIPLFISTVVFFLIWEHRAFSNLAALKTNNLEFSPGWAVGWWFIPFANLIKPFQAMRELWVESDPEVEEDLGFLSVSPGAPTIMIVWWAAWLLTNFTDRIANKMIESEFFPVAMITASLIEIVAAGLLIKIILEIVQRQELRFQKLGNSQQFAPPQPPVFNQPFQS